MRAVPATDFAVAGPGPVGGSSKALRKIGARTIGDECAFCSAGSGRSYLYKSAEDLERSGS
jgi:hypothetical protein